MCTSELFVLRVRRWAYVGIWRRKITIINENVRWWEFVKQFATNSQLKLLRYSWARKENARHDICILHTIYTTPNRSPFDSKKTFPISEKSISFQSHLRAPFIDEFRSITSSQVFHGICVQFHANKEQIPCDTNIQAHCHGGSQPTFRLLLAALFLKSVAAAAAGCTFRSFELQFYFHFEWRLIVMNLPHLEMAGLSLSWRKSN